MDLSSFTPLSASCISLRTLFTALLAVSACFASSCLIADSTLALISVAGMVRGVTAKFSPLLSRAISASLRNLEDKLITQLVLSTSYGQW